MKNKVKYHPVSCKKLFIPLQINIILFLLLSSFLPAESPSTLENIILSITADSGVINAKKQYLLSLIDTKYRFLYWWNPSLVLSNNLVYPYEKKEFDNTAANNVSSVDLSLPLPSGSSITIGSSYSLIRDVLDTSTLEKQDWGFAQDLGFNVGLYQSLNPWWFHTSKNPYSRMALIQNSLSKNEYNITVKTKLLASVQSFISLRKIERSIVQIKKTLDFYDELLQAYQDLRMSGGISLREYEKVHSDKWDYENELFNLENNRSAVQEELYRLTGTLIENVYNEPLFDPDNPVFMQIFMDIHKDEVTSLEETNLHLTKENLRINQIINKQTNSPGIKVVWGTQYNLPVKSAGSLWDAWKDEKNFNDNKLNNWSLTFTVDISSLLSPVNRRDTLRYNQETFTINELLKGVAIERQKDKELNMLIIHHIEDQIKRLSAVLLNDQVRMQEDETLKNDGVITIVDYKQRRLIFTEKETLLSNLQDDLWFYTFIKSFLY
jgi:hypothetical protein